VKAAQRLTERNQLMETLAAIDALLRQLFEGRYSNRVGAQCRSLLAERTAFGERLSELGGDPGELPMPERLWQ
jgi:hypothetical protein